MKTYILNICYLHLLEDEIEKIIGTSTNVIRMNYDEVSIKNITDECLYYSLLDEEKYVIVNNFKLNESSNGIIDYINKPNPKTTLILIIDKSNKRNAIYKLVEQNKGVIEITDLKVKDMISKINSYCLDKNINIDYQGATKLLENNLNNYDLVINEINKMAIISNKITIDDIKTYDDAIVGDDSLALADAITSKNRNDIRSLLDDFISSKGDVIGLTALLASSYRLIYAAKCSNLSSDEIAIALNVHPYRLKLAKEKSYNYTKDELMGIIISLCDLDFYLKSENINQYSLLKMFLINI